MMLAVDFIPPEASSISQKIDLFSLYIFAISAFFSALIFCTILFLVLRYRRRPGIVSRKVTQSPLLEITWTVIPLLIVLSIFVWGTRLYIELNTPPRDAMEVYVIGKQWMWKIQHPEGRREIDELHVPVGRDVMLTLTSQDVIHAFFIPAFRTKIDVVPGRYSEEWFRPTRVGEYHLFCSEYCGTGHATMVGRVVVMEPQDYAAWLAGGVADEPPRVTGERLFTQFNCAQCHGRNAPTLAGLYMSQVELENHAPVIADEQYLRESILDPSAKIVKGFKPLMPSFRGQLTEEQVMDLVEYIKSLKDEKGLTEP